MSADARFRGPLLDLRVRWRVGQVILGFAALAAILAALRPLSPGAGAGLRLGATALLAVGITVSALLASLRNRGTAETVAFYAFLALALDGLGQVLAPLGWPTWPLLALLVSALAVAEAPPIALGVAALASALAAADAAHRQFATWPSAVVSTVGYASLVLALQLALRGEKRRLNNALAELARLTHGIDHLQENPEEPTPGPAAGGLRQVSEQGRRSRHTERAAELDQWLQGVVTSARAALDAHAVLYFDFDREAGRGRLRAADGPPTLLRDATVPLTADPLAFVVDRGETFYATDFKKLLWSLPYYRGEVKIGTLVAVPVRTGGAVQGAIVADTVEAQAWSGGQPRVLALFADLAGESIGHVRAASRREDTGAEFKAVYDVSRQLANLTDPVAIRLRLLACARDLVAHEAAAVVMADRPQTRYVVENAQGWAAEYQGREVGLLERTWAAWLLKHDEPGVLLDDLAGGERMPVLVLDEGSSRAESLLAVALRTQQRTIGALILTGRRGTFDSAAKRVLTILANQAAGALHVCQLLDHEREKAIHDALTGLHNRRAFNEALVRAAAHEDRHGGSFALLLLDIDHFKKLNDTFGHPAGDAVLRHTAQLLGRHLRKSDLAARYGGEEFAVILASTDRAGAAHLAEKVRATIEKGQLVEGGARLSVTASFGLAVWPEDGRDVDALLAAADRALYGAKQTGRNRVVDIASLPTEATTAP